MDKLFEPVQEGHDGKGRVVFICKDASGFYVYKPATGFKTKHWEGETDDELVSCFDRQVSCTQNHAFLEDHEHMAEGEVYELVAAAPGGPLV